MMNHSDVKLSVENMDCIAIMDSGNFALKLYNILARKGYVFEVVSTPCQIARNGCSYCLMFPMEFKDMVLQEAALNKVAVREMYSVEKQFTKNKYSRVY
jgi:hypothetical protein